MMITRHRIAKAVAGLGLIAMIITATACSANTPSTAGQTTIATTPCHVTSADLTIAGGGTAVATKASLTGTHTLNISGSTALTPLFQKAQVAFDVANGTNTTITPNGSDMGLSQVANGTVAIGMSDIFASEDHIAGLTDHQVAAVIFTVVVSPDLQGKITNLTTQQLKAIYAGTITNWDQIPGGPNEVATVVVRSSGSGTRATFDRYVIGQPTKAQDEPATALVAKTTSDLVAAVSTHHGAIGYAATSYTLDSSQIDKVVPVCINGIGATTMNVDTGKYQFWSFEHAYTKTGVSGVDDAIVQAFLAYVNSNDFQTLDLPSSGFMQVGQIPPAIAATHQVTETEP